jgi:F-type H+-transporting ATPase subunit epsilon
MPGTFRLTLVTQEKELFSLDVVSVMAPGSEGYLGIMARHAPLLTELDIGELKVTYPDGRVGFYALEGGLLEVSKEGAVVLADAAEPEEEIDEERARAARERARQRLEGALQDYEQLDFERARAALLRAINRLRIVERRKGR